MRSAITVSLVPEASGGPFLCWDDFPASAALARSVGCDGIELFAPGPNAVPSATLRSCLGDHGLRLAAVGTGAGWVIHKLTLTHSSVDIRNRAFDFVRGMIDYAGPFGAPVIIGSMQGRWGDCVDKPTALKLLSDQMALLGEHARQFSVPLIYEPLNRYETNLVNTLVDGVSLVNNCGCNNVRLLADLFHMNIEEVNIAAAIESAADAIGHVHLADSNRRPAGGGHTDFAPIGAALRKIGYTGYVSAEAFSWPDAPTAAQSTMTAYRKFFAF